MLNATQQAASDVGCKAEWNYKDTENNICCTVNKKLNLAVLDTYKFNAMAMVSQGRNYPVNTNLRDKLRMRYGKATRPRSN